MLQICYKIPVMRYFRPVIAIGGLLILFSAALRCEEPAQVTVCELKANPADYNHKLIEVIGFVSHGFEDFGLLTLVARHGLTYGSSTVERRSRARCTAAVCLTAGLVLRNSWWKELRFRLQPTKRSTHSTSSSGRIQWFTQHLSDGFLQAKNLGSWAAVTGTWGVVAY